MRKIISFLSILFVFCVFNAKADTTSTELANIPDTSKVTFSRVYNDVKAGMKGLGEALKVGAEHVYVVLVKQQVVKAIQYIIFGIIGLIFLLISLYVMKKARWGDNTYYFPEQWKSKEEWQANQFNKYSVYTIITGLITSIFLMNFIINLDTVVMGLYNPEYGAIKDILNFVK